MYNLHTVCNQRMWTGLKSHDIKTLFVRQSHLYMHMKNTNSTEGKKYAILIKGWFWCNWGGGVNIYYENMKGIDTVVLTYYTFYKKIKGVSFWLHGFCG